jgi:flavin reductase (DIM6/NTAB) family NADH-FMN oxidoreductase RutF
MSKIKLELSAGLAPILCAHPVVLTGAQVDGKPNFAAVAWTGVAASNPPAITIALQPHRYTLKGIRTNMTFSVNIPSTAIVNETDYCGIVSGSKSDKVADCHFKVFYGKLDTAPLIEQCPVNHACEVVQILKLGSHELIVGRIVESYISDDCITDGRPDVGKIRPFLFTLSAKYHALGDTVGDAFRTGQAINPARVNEAKEEFRKIRPPL